MKRNLKRIFAILLTLVMVFSSSSAFLASPIDLDETARMLERDRLLLQSPEHQAISAQREAEFREWLRQDEINRRNSRSLFSSMTLNISAFQQERGNWCGPATARQVIHFRNGNAPTQTDLAGLIGTHSGGSDVYDVGRVVRLRTGLNYNPGHLSTDRDTWVHQIRNSIHNMRPAILTIRTTNIAAFPYNSEGHIVNVSGYEVGTALDPWGNPVLIGSVRITDPHNGAGLGNRWYSIDALHNAHTTNRRGQGSHFVGRASW